MPSITNDDFTLSEDYLTNVIRSRQVDAEIAKRLRAILNTCMGLTPSGPDGVIIRDNIREGQQFLAKYGNALGDGFILENVGKKFLEYADEIYSCDPNLMIAKAKVMTPDKFMKVIEGCVSVYEKMEDVTRLVPLYKHATEICEISAFASL
jgi:hypothetical protein